MHKSAHAAKLAAPHAIYQPALVLLADGSYDTFPLGHPIPRGAVIIARKESHNGRVKWRDIKERCPRCGREECAVCVIAEFEAREYEEARNA